jgi:hypothetical protein
MHKDSETVYIRMIHEDDIVNDSPPQEEISVSILDSPLDSVGWQPRYEAIKQRYQHAPWIPGDAWEFTPRDGIMHIRNCETCATYKQHVMVAEAVYHPSESAAWNIHKRYERDLIQTGWDIARENGRISPEGINANELLRQQKHYLATQVESLQRTSHQAAIKIKELSEELESEQFDMSLCAGDANFWQDQYEYIHKKYSELEEQMIRNLPNPLVPIRNEGDNSRASALTNEPLRRTDRSELSLNASTSNEVTRPCDRPESSLIAGTSDGVVI